MNINMSQVIDIPTQNTEEQETKVCVHRDVFHELIEGCFGFRNFPLFGDLDDRVLKCQKLNFCSLY